MADSKTNTPPPSEKTLKAMKETGITEDMIKNLVHSFYDKIRADDILGPIFNKHIENWDPHLEKMCEFWSSATLKTGKYGGNPLQKHHPLPIDSRHFDHWLELFAKTADELCPPSAADEFKKKSVKIAASLELGVAIKNGDLPIAGNRYINENLKL